MLINNRYQVIRPLGEGGFGHAYLAEDTQMPSQRKCVIKQLKPITTSPEVYQVVQDRFQREAAILEQLGDNHPQIPRLYAYFTEGQKFYLVQEWIEGETLEELVVPQPESVVTNVIVSLLPVLDFIHKRGIIHRDLKPENIILRSGTGQISGQPVLIDFGAVRETMGTVMNSHNHPTSSIVIGTPGYMSAEQAAGRPIPSSDLYSLGLTAIYLLTGQMPQSLQLDPQTGELVWQQLAAHVSVGLRAILDRAVRSHPRDRYSTATDMIQALSTLPGVSSAFSPANFSPSDRSASALPATVLPISPPSQPLASPPPQVPLPITPAASELQTQAVAATHRQSPQTAPNTVFTGNSLLSSGDTQTRQPWFKKLTPLTIGLSVLLIGGSAIALGMVIAQGSIDDPAQPSRSATNPADSPESVQPSSTPEDAEDGKAETAKASDRTDAPPTEPEDAAPPKPDNPSPTRDDTAPPVEIVTGPVVFSESQPVTLGNTSTGQIDVYEQPSFLAETPSYGVTGDLVLSLGETVRAETGLVWYKIRFDSGVEGWIPESNIVSFGSPAPVDPPVPPTPSVPTSADILSRAPKFTTLAGPSSDRINVRSSPSTSASSPHYGVGGDPVQIIDAVRGNDGYNWYFVAFESGADGWVREDLIRL